VDDPDRVHDRRGVSPPLNEPDVELPVRDPEAERVAYNRTRWRDGRVAVWLSARRGTGRGSGSSGLRFDFLSDT